MGWINLEVGDTLSYSFINNFRNNIEYLYNKLQEQGTSLPFTLDDVPIPDVSEGYETSIYKIRDILNTCEENINLLHQVMSFENPNYIGRHFWTKRKIPYQQVEYIESDGGQYILTNIVPNQKFTFIVEFLTKSKLGNEEGFGCIFGARTSSGTKDFQFTTWGTEGQGTLRWGNNSTNQINAGLSKDVYQKSSLLDGYFPNFLIYTSPNKTTTEFTLTEEEGEYPISIFGLNEAGEVIQTGEGCRIYSLRFYDDNGDLRGDFVPCRYETTYGLYDTVSDKMYTNEGTGDFVGGVDIIQSNKEKVVRWVNWLEYAKNRIENVGFEELFDVSGEQIYDIDGEEIYVRSA